jgi:2-oxoglutarate dehydrogenase E2 component (dihydrolipoamide succinyltransferase)
MARMNIVLPAMGEGVIEATINKWLVKEGASVNEDDPIVEIATDKVDTEIPSPASGILAEIKAVEGSVIKVGSTLAVIETEVKATPEGTKKVEKEVERIRETIEEVKDEKKEEKKAPLEMKSRTPSGKFLSPLVRSIASREGISYDELDTLSGTGKEGRITRDDILKYLEGRKGTAVTASEEEKTGVQPEEEKTGVQPEEEKTGVQSVEEKTGVQVAAEEEPEPEVEEKATISTPEVSEVKKTSGIGDEIIEMDRIRKLTAEHMLMSKKTSAHVTSFIDADVTGLIRWRNSVKDKFLAAEGQKLTLTPIFIDAAAKAIYELPMLNISVEGNTIIKKKNINIGMATALQNDNLIVPVIRNANEKSLTGLARAVNDLAERARKNKLKPDEITGGTFTVTNFGSYNNLSGTPIINQPQVAILGTGAVRKVPAVIETPEGDVIAIRHVMILSLSYDHRVIDGALAGKFLNKIKDILENYNPGNI